MTSYRRIASGLNRLSWLPNVVLRLTVGFMFFSGAVGKLGALDQFTRMFADLGIAGSQVIAPATAVAELLGGAALMLGVVTRLASAVLAAVMVGALITVVGPDLAQKYPAWWDFLSNLFYAPEWLLLGVLLWLVCVGPGERGRALSGRLPVVGHIHRAVHRGRGVAGQEHDDLGDVGR